MLLLALLLLSPQKPVDGFQARTYKTMPYRLFVPPDYDKSHPYPLILWLHGAGSVGGDNFKQISGASLRGTHTWTAPQVQAKHPAFVLAPQSRIGSWTMDFPLVLELLNSVESEFNIDAARIYVAGQSLGGFGTWYFITTRPDLFAAAIPLCGGGNSSRASVITHIPIWAFHGESDPTVPVTESRKMIAAIRQAGGDPRYTEYRGVGHDVWFRAFQEPGLVEWLFSQHK
ncbi:MAG: phospholipase [Acidobacteria bacterium]|nr:MAG: phospholipase [Acidobacteriota bacterium]